MKHTAPPERDIHLIEPAALLAEQQGAPPEPTAAFRRILSNAVANIARQASALVVVLLLPPLLVRSLDQSTYAVWLLILQISSYITLIDNGIQTVVARYVALERARSGAAGVARVLTNATVLLSIISLLTLIVSVTGSSALSWFIPHKFAGLLAPAKHAFMITAVVTALALPFSTLAGLFTGDQRSEVNALATTVGKVVGAAGVAWTAMRHGGLEAMAVALAVGTVLQSLLYVAASRFRQTAELFSLGLVQGSYLTEIFTFSIGMMVSQLAGLLISGMDLPMVSAFDFPQTAYYGLALTASNLLLVPFAALTGPLMPLVTSVHAQGDARRLGDLVIEITRWGNLLLGLLVLFLGMSLPALLHWWVRQEYAVHALPLAEILLLAQGIRLTCALYSLTGFSAGEQKQMLVSPVAEGLVNLLCSFVGAKLMGAAGVAWGTVIGALAGVLLHLLVNIPRTQGVIRLDRRRFVLQSIVLPLLAVSAVVPVFLLAHTYTRTPAESFALAAVCVMMDLPLAWLWGLRAEDRVRILRFLNSRGLKLQANA